MTFEPLTSPVDYILLDNRRSPGIAVVNAASSPRRWDERRGYAQTGARLLFRGRGLARPIVTLRLYTAQDWTDWHEWRELVQFGPSPAVARAQRAGRQRDAAIRRRDEIAREVTVNPGIMEDEQIVADLQEASSRATAVIGYFVEDVTGDGTLTTLVTLFEEISLDAWDNDSNPNDVQASDIFAEVYLKDQTTVSTSDNGATRSKAGRAFLIENNRVYLQQGLAVAGPTGGSFEATQQTGVADKTALAAIVAASRANGMLVLVRADGSLWRFDSAATATADENQELIITPDAGTGRWIRADKTPILKLAVGFVTADGDPLLTVPAGFALRLTGLPFWEVSISFTGGAASAIGVASSVTGYTAAGDILGGASGDIAAALTAGIRPGTIGDAMDTEAERQAFVLVAADTLTFERITSAFTAGAGFVRVPVAIAHPV